MPEQEHKNLPKGKDGLEEAPKQDKDEPLHERIKRSMAATHNTSRDVEVKEVHPVGQNLYVARVSHTPASGVRKHDEALVFDKDDEASLWFR